MKFYCECRYCGNKWSETFWTQQAMSNSLIMCERCKDRDVKMIPDTEWDRDPYGYNKVSPELKKTRST